MQVEDVKIQVPMTNCTPELKSNILNYINNLRKKHQAPILKEDVGISRYSQDWANDLAKRNGTDYKKGNKHGKEALILGDWKVDINDSQKVYPLFNTEGFLNRYLSLYGLNDYPYDKEPTQEEADKYDPYTRIIWKASDTVGIGCSANYSSPTWSTINIVLNFYSTGNILGQYKNNVLKAI